MSRLTSQGPAPFSSAPRDDRPGYYPVPERGYGHHGRGPSGLLMFGLVAAGVGLLAWNYLGPDLRRYVKIKSM